jgi:S-DNA-T family DNA segregation ATPase FtsK/SpoIIIE
LPDDDVTRIIDTGPGGEPRSARHIVDLEDEAPREPLVIGSDDLAARPQPEIVISDRDVGQIAARQARERLRLGTAAPPSIQLRVSIGTLETHLDVVVRGTADVAVRVLSRAASERLTTAVASHRLWCVRRRCWLADSLPLHAAGVLWGDRLLLHAPASLPADAMSPQAVTRTGAGDAGAGGSLTGRLDFNRPPRVARPVDPLAQELRAPPERPRKPRVPWIAIALPLLIGIPMYFLVGPLFLIFLALMPMMSIGTYFSERRGGRKDFEEASAEFEQRVLTAQAELQQAAATEAAELRRRAPAPGVVVGRARKPGDGLWERRRTDADFVSLRVGLADKPTSSRVTIARGGAEHLRSAAEAKLDIRLTMSDVPVLVDPLEEGAVGVCGDPARVAALARWFAVQAATLHSPADLVIGAAVAHDQAAQWDWMKWLPHASDERSPFESAPRALGDIESRELLENVRELCAQRARDRADHTQAVPEGPAVLLFIDERVRLERILVAELLKRARAGDIAVVWLGSNRNTLPGECAVIVELPFRSSAGRVVHATSGVVHDEVAIESSSLQEAEMVARALAPLRDMSAGGRAAAIPRRIALLELLSMPEPNAADIVARWAFAPDSLEAAIGATAGRQHIVDLRAHGPHALVAGTTGSGKSELLRSWIASLAMTHPPSRLTFLLVDYKGGAAFGPCVRLPHVVELVTDLDERLVQRALISLDAELHRREALLAAARAKDLLELQRRMPDSAPPALVIVVDEFAKLREEVPEFVDGVVDVAQRGRSLGVHMILAAQSLRNAFTPAIRANTNLRIALRVSDENESDDVISAKDAARIPAGPGHTGRGFTRTGHGILDEFQTAYVSGRTRAGAGPELTVWSLAFGGASEPVSGEDEVPVSDEDTDLTALADAAQSARAALALPLPTGPWLAPLPDILPLDEVQQSAGDDPTSAVAIGLIDDPAHQSQEPLELRFESAGNIVVFGGGGSGKSMLLRTCAVAMATSMSSDDVHIYAIDGPGRRLAALNGLPHCGGVAPFDDAESVDALLALLARRIETRSAEFAAAGITSLSEARTDRAADRRPRRVPRRTRRPPPRWRAGATRAPHGHRPRRRRACRRHRRTPGRAGHGSCGDGRRAIDPRHGQPGRHGQPRHRPTRGPHAEPAGRARAHVGEPRVPRRHPRERGRRRDADRRLAATRARSARGAARADRAGHPRAGGGDLGGRPAARGDARPPARGTRHR